MSTSTPRRSARPRICKSALELLGITPKTEPKEYLDSQNIDTPVRVKHEPDTEHLSSRRVPSYKKRKSAQIPASDLPSEINGIQEQQCNDVVGASTQQVHMQSEQAEERQLQDFTIRGEVVAEELQSFSLVEVTPNDAADSGTSKYDSLMNLVSASGLDFQLVAAADSCNTVDGQDDNMVIVVVPENTTAATTETTEPQLQSALAENEPEIIPIVDPEATPVEEEEAETSVKTLYPPVTSSDIFNAEWSRSGWRVKPVKQIVMTTDLQAILDELTAQDCMDKHIVYDNSPYYGRRKKHIHMRCRYCDLTLHDRHDFRRHIKTHKEVDYSPYICPICGYKAQIRASIARHINIHSPVKPYNCEECGKGFNFKQKLQLHMKYHMDLRDEQCPLCDNAFHEYKTLKTHMFKLHGVTNMREYFAGIGQPRGVISGRKSRVTRLIRQGRANMKTVKTVKMEGTERPEGEEEEEGEETDDAYEDVDMVHQNDGNNQSEIEQITQSEAGIVEPSRDIVQADPKSVQSLKIESQKIVPSPTSTEEIATGLQSSDVQNGTAHAANAIESSQQGGTRRSTLYGTRKTDQYTSRYKMGLAPQKRVSKHPRCVLKEGAVSGKRNRFVNNQRIVEEAQVDRELLEYCTVNSNTATFKVLFQCRLCEMNPFPSHTQFRTHLESAHPDVKAWKCSQCEFRCRLRTSLSAHVRIHSGVKDHTCNLCGKGFFAKQKLETHMQAHLNLRQFACDKCGLRFNDNSNLKKHVQRKHSTLRPHVCLICDRKYKEKSQLDRHMDTHSAKKKHFCKYCEKYYQTKISLYQHMKSHSCLFHCEICNKGFGSYSGFMAHKVMHDESYAGYVCEICQKVLHTKGSLHRHKTVAHTDLRPFACTECAKNFKTKKDLKNHSYCHTEERAFRCPVCDYLCKRSDSLRVHMRRHLPTKPFCCIACPQQYTQQHSLDIHMKRHEATMDTAVKFKCDHCFRVFSGKYKLNSHMRQSHPDTQTDSDATMPPIDIPPTPQLTVFMCEECNGVFSSQDDLAVHILSEHMKRGWPMTIDGRQEAIETFVTINDPGSAQPRVVSILQPVIPQEQPVTIPEQEPVEENGNEYLVLDHEQPVENVLVDMVPFDDGTLMAVGTNIEIPISMSEQQDVCDEQPIVDMVHASIADTDDMVS